MWMEQGGTLFEMAGNCSEQTIKTIFRKLLEGTVHMHSNNVAHRDLKLEVWGPPFAGGKRLCTWSGNQLPEGREHIPGVGTNHRREPFERTGEKRPPKRVSFASLVVDAFVSGRVRGLVPCATS